MKTTTFIGVLAVAISILGSHASHADHTANPKLAAAIKQQGEKVQHDAAIYQRRRVTSDVLSLDADVSTLDKLIAPHKCLKTQRRLLQQALADLRDASQKSDANRTNATVERVTAITEQVLKISCDKSNQ